MQKHGVKNNLQTPNTSAKNRQLLSFRKNFHYRSLNKSPNLHARCDDPSEHREKEACRDWGTWSLLYNRRKVHPAAFTNRKINGDE